MSDGWLSVTGSSLVWLDVLLSPSQAARLSGHLSGTRPVAFRPMVAHGLAEEATRLSIRLPCRTDLWLSCPTVARGFRPRMGTSLPCADKGDAAACPQEQALVKKAPCLRYSFTHVCSLSQRTHMACLISCQRAKKAGGAPAVISVVSSGNGKTLVGK